MLNNSSLKINLSMKNGKHLLVPASKCDKYSYEILLHRSYNKLNNYQNIF